MIRQTVYYSGRVQGVGFRFTACHLARGYQVCGTVRNLPDGTVELIAEGEAQEVKAYLGELGERMAANIRHADVHSGEPTGRFQGFVVIQ